ncbi:hypothetical protein RZE82_05850 [Mollicutes bacterium LVI A0039]|nr:hypothetical protein RZE82_05850 [Mollicutes bacterium LVI A0039]
MKKLIVVIATGFLFCIFFGLGMFAMFTNTFGINVNTEGLFPAVDITVLEDGLFSEEGFSRYSYIYNQAGSENIKIVNKTGFDLNVGLSFSEDPTSVGTVEYNFFSDNLRFKQIDDTTLEVYSIPDEYDYYFDNRRFRHSDTPYLSALINEEYDYNNVSEDGESPVINRDDLVILKDGESYEIKLS